jgi:5-methylcytosine-specific restriction endonuclease McrA
MASSRCWMSRRARSARRAAVSRSGLDNGVPLLTSPVLRLSAGVEPVGFDLVVSDPPQVPLRTHEVAPTDAVGSHFHVTIVYDTGAVCLATIKGMCSIPSCESPVLARGWCSAHYQRWRHHGDPLAGAPSPAVRASVLHDDGTRTCTICQIRKPLDEFHIDRLGSDGRRASCKSCRSARMKTWYADNQERQRDRQRDRYARNGDALRAADMVRYQRDKPKRLALVEASMHVRRATLRRSPSVPGITKNALRERNGDLCHYCEAEMDFTPSKGHGFVPLRATIEHIIPLSLGGAHDWENVALCCWRCNVRKNRRTPAQWADALAREAALGNAADPPGGV